MAKGRRTDGDVIEEIQRLVVEHDYSAAFIERRMSQDERFASRLPGLRVIQSIARNARPADESGEWRLDPTAADEDDRHVLEILADVVVWTDGRRQRLSQAEARTTIGLRRVAGDLPVRLTYRLARYYLARTASGSSTADLDLWLAFAPWRDSVARAAYEGAIEQGVPRAPIDQSVRELQESTRLAVLAKAAEVLARDHPAIRLAGEWPTMPPDADPALAEDAFSRIDLDAVVKNLVSEQEEDAT